MIIIYVYLLAVVSRLVRIDILVLIGAGPLSRSVLDTRLVFSLRHGPELDNNNYTGGVCVCAHELDTVATDHNTVK